MDVPPFSLETLDSTPSTMDAARGNVLEGRVTFDEEGMPSSWGVFAREQTAGRGQRGRTWYAARGESLCATYYIRHRFALPEEAGWISLMSGVVVAGCLSMQGSLQNVGLKWPNDILLNGRKAGGILVEMLRAPDGGWTALVGVGINMFVTEFPEELRGSATSLLLASANPASLPLPNQLGRAVAASLNDQAVSKDVSARSNWVRIWRTLDSGAGLRYETEWKGKNVVGTARGIDDDGALMLQLDDGSLIAVTSASSLREMASFAP